MTLWPLLAVSVLAVAPTSGAIQPAQRSCVSGLIAYTSRAGDIWVMRANGSHRRRVTRAGGRVDFDPDFSPDGKRLVFRSERGRQPPDPYGIGYDALFVVNTDGTGLRQTTRRAVASFQPGLRAAATSRSAARRPATPASTTSH